MTELSTRNASQITEQERALLTKLANKVVQLRMSAPAILFLESVRPMNYVGSQVMVFFSPLVRGFFGLPEWDELSRILEKRESIGLFLDLIEEQEGLFLIEEQKQKAERKRLKREEKEIRKQKRLKKNG